MDKSLDASLTCSVLDEFLLQKLEMFSCIALFATLLAIVNLTVNVSVLLVTISSHRLRRDPVTRIISSLAVSDLGFGAFVPGVGAVLTFARIKPIPVVLEAMLATCFQILGTCSLLHLTFVAFVKCGIIAKPLVYFTVFTDRVIVAVIAGIWFVSVVLGSMPAFVGAQFRFEPEICMPSTVTHGVLFSSIHVTCFLVSTTLVIVLYSKVFLAVRRQLRSILGVVLVGGVAAKPEEGVAPARATPPTSGTVPEGCMIHTEGIVLEGGPAPNKQWPTGELTKEVNTDGVALGDVGTRESVTNRNASEEKTLRGERIDEKHVPDGIVPVGVVVNMTAGANVDPVEASQGEDRNDDPVELVSGGEWSAEDFVPKAAGDIVSRMATPGQTFSAQSTTGQVIREKKASGETLTKRIQFSAGKAKDPFGQTSALGQSVRSAKNLFIISGVYLLTYIPAFMSIFKVVYIPPEALFPMKIGAKWTYISASTFNGLLYIVLHRSVRAELLRLICRRPRSMVSELGKVDKTTKV